MCRKLLELGTKLTLEKAITIIRTAEATRLQSSNMKQGTAAPVHQIKSATGKRPNDRQADSQRSQPRGKPSVRWHPPGCQPYGCWSCGAASRHAKEECPAFGKECHTCHKSGHFQSVCSQGSSSPKTEIAGSSPFSPSFKTTWSGSVSLLPAAPRNISFKCFQIPEHPSTPSRLAYIIVTSRTFHNLLTAPKP